MQEILARFGGNDRSGSAVCNVTNVTEDEAARLGSSTPMLNVLCSAYCRGALPIKHLAIIRWIVCQIVKLRDLSCGDRQAHEKK